MVQFGNYFSRSSMILVMFPKEAIFKENFKDLEDYARGSAGFFGRFAEESRVYAVREKLWLYSSRTKCKHLVPLASS
jgi:hypothetical protein